MSSFAITKRRSFPWILAFGYFTVHGLLLFTYKFLDDRSHSRSGTALVRLIEELTAAYAAACLIPLAIKFARRFRPRWNNWPQRLPLHLGALIIFSAAHTSLIFLARRLLFGAIGLGTYNYGILPIRYAMELANDALFYWLLIIIVYLFDHYRESHQRELQTAHLQASLSHAQLQGLRLQLQPHFLFNALNTISSVIYENVELADRMIARLSELLRITLDNSESQEVTLKEELRLLDLYLEIMRVRFEERLFVSLNVSPETEKALVPQLILQPLVENSIKHATDPQSGSVAIHVDARKENGSLLLEVSDNGPGIKCETDGNINRGVGLPNAAERLRQLYGTSQNFNVTNATNGGLKVQIKVPFHTA